MKNKIVFVLVLACVVLFIVSYSIVTFGRKKTDNVEGNQVQLPDLKDSQKQYDSKLEAVDDIKQERPKTAPSIYPDHMVDEKGYFNPDYMEYEKQRIIDSIYQDGGSRYAETEFQNIHSAKAQEIPKTQNPWDAVDTLKDNSSEANNQVASLSHQLFFASNGTINKEPNRGETDDILYLRVDGTQTVRTDERLRLRFIQGARIGGARIERNTVVYGQVRFKPNRTLIEIQSISHQSVDLKAYDRSDGREGIFIRNNFRARATNELLGDMVNDINLTGMPQLSGLKRIFRRSAQNTKVTVLDGYKLLLKPSRTARNSNLSNSITQLP